MANLFDYITWRGDLDFTQSELNPVDYVIFSQLSYLPFDGIVPAPGEKEGITLNLALKTLSEKLEKSSSDSKPQLTFKEDPELIKALASSKRFGNCHLLGFINRIDVDREYQFSALCIYPGDGSCSIVYRGTDASFVGWKEDFNMAFREIIPSQLEAVKYLETMAPLVKGDLRIGGHSKGGNLAVFAASFCNKKIQNRIIDIYSNDAPGFYEKIITSDEFAAIKNRIHSYIPQASVVGMLLERGSDYIVIKSSEIGLMQHSLYTWQVTHNDMVYADKVAISSRFVDKTIRHWVESLDKDQRERFIDAVYTILSSSEVKSVHELERSWLLSMGRIIKSIGNIDDPTRKLMMKTVSELFRSVGKNLDTLFKKEDE